VDKKVLYEGFEFRIVSEMKDISKTLSEYNEFLEKIK
jgi:hypothetical protein